MVKTKKTILYLQGEYSEMDVRVLIDNKMSLRDAITKIVSEKKDLIDGENPWMSAYRNVVWHIKDILSIKNLNPSQLSKSMRQAYDINRKIYKESDLSYNRFKKELVKIKMEKEFSDNKGK